MHRAAEDEIKLVISCFGAHVLLDTIGVYIESRLTRWGVFQTTSEVMISMWSHKVWDRCFTKWAGVIAIPL